MGTECGKDQEQDTVSPLITQVLFSVHFFLFELDKSVKEVVYIIFIELSTEGRDSSVSGMFEVGTALGISDF